MEHRYRLSFITTAMLCLSAACGSDAPAGLPIAPGGAGSPGVAPVLPTTGQTTTPVVTPPTSIGAAGAPARPAGTAGAPSVIQPPAGAAGNGSVAPATGPVPCDVSKIMAAKCQTCHGAMPIGGAPMSLVTHADFQKQAVTMPSMKVYQVVQLRLHDKMRPMPPMGELTATELGALDNWLKAGALAGTPADAMCDTKPPSVAENLDGSRGALTAGPGETCYEFQTHGSTTSVDASAYDVGGDGEHYEQFYFKVPWPKDTVATAYATKIDNAPVLHHWLLFSTAEGDPEGFHKTAPLPTLIGTDPVLLAGWAVGGPNLVAPKHVGFELPGPGRTINVQWHFYNSTGKPQKDRSAVQICTVPKAMRANVGGVTWLGTEDLNGNKWFGGAGMPPHKESTFTTTCIPGRRGVAANQSIFIIGFEPHMHRIGKRMSTSVKKADGTMQMVFDKPFSFGNETHYYQDYELKPGETLVTSCTFNNDNDFGVPFGESSDTEMCYQFTFAYPAHALSNGAPSLLGVTDTCW